MFAISGAAGKTGRAVCRAYSARGFPVRALVRRPQQQALMERCGAAEVRVVDLTESESLRRAIAGTTAVVHICPNLHPAEIDIGQSMIAAARQEKIERFVYFSVLHPQTERMPHHWKKLRVEELLVESGLGFTVLQPAPFMQNLLAQWDRMSAGGSFRVPYSAASRTALVDLEDVGQAAVEVVLEDEHLGASYQLCGESGLSVRDIAAVLGRHFGRTVEIEEQTPEQWAQSAHGQSFSSYQRQTLTAMFRFYQNFGLCGGTKTLSWLLGRRPTPLETMLARGPAKLASEA